MALMTRPPPLAGQALVVLWGRVCKQVWIQACGGSPPLPECPPREAGMGPVFLPPGGGGSGSGALKAPLDVSREQGHVHTRASTHTPQMASCVHTHTFTHTHMYAHTHSCTRPNTNEYPPPPLNVLTPTNTQPYLPNQHVGTLYILCILI